MKSTPSMELLLVPKRYIVLRIFREFSHDFEIVLMQFFEMSLKRLPRTTMQYSCPPKRKLYEWFGNTNQAEFTFLV